mgnify:CR=1 FL=1
MPSNFGTIKANGKEYHHPMSIQIDGLLMEVQKCSWEDVGVHELLLRVRDELESTQKECSRRAGLLGQAVAEGFDIPEIDLLT